MIHSLFSLSHALVCTRCFRMDTPEICGQSAGKPIEAPVAHADDQVAASSRLKQKPEQFAGSREKVRILLPFADIIYEPLGVEALRFGNGVHRMRLFDADDVRCRKSDRVEILENVSPTRVAPGLESGDNAALGIEELQTKERFVNRSWMMSEIVHHQNSFELAYDVPVAVLLH